jgi:C-terminal region of Mon2 protein
LFEQGAWRVWLNVGIESTKIPLTEADKTADELYIPSQAFLTALVQIFPALFQHIHTRFTDDDLKKLCNVLMHAVMVPVHSDSTPYIMSTMSDSLLTPLHDGILECMELLQKEATAGNVPINTITCAVFKQLLSFSKFACSPPYYENRKRSIPTNSIEWVSMNYIPFGEKSMSVATKLYQQTASDERVIEGEILHEIIKALSLPLGLKYKCMSSSTWKLAITSLMSVLHYGLPVARKHPKEFANMWNDLSDTLDKFLFPKR